MNAIIIYQGKYGATEQYAHWLGTALNVNYLNARDITPAYLRGHNTVILGSSVYVGKLVIAKWLHDNAGALTGKKIFLFIVCGTTANDAAEKQRLIANNLDAAMQVATQVFFVPGRCVVSKLSWRDHFILKMGAWMQKDPVKKAAMMQGFDRMDQKSLDGLIAAAKLCL